MIEKDKLKEVWKALFFRVGTWVRIKEGTERDAAGMIGKIMEIDSLDDYPFAVAIWDEYERSLGISWFGYKASELEFYPDEKERKE